MKKLLIGTIILICSHAQAQTTQRKAASPTKRANDNNAMATRQQQQMALNSTGSYQAKAPSASGRLWIADPTIRALNNRREGAEIPMFGTNSILGLPKGTYGYRKGQLWLRSTDATSIGGVTGNSSVGNGSSAGGVGTGGFVNGVNGKSPYAGAGIWGSAQGMQLPDSVLRRSRPALPQR